MINSKRYFSGLNSDDDAIALGETDALNIENMRIGADEYGKNFQLRNIPSTTVLFSGLPAGVNLTIGRIANAASKREVFFNQNSLGEHGIYCYDDYAKTTYIVLLSSQTEKGLNFSKAFRISRNARLYGSLLIYSDNNNEPQCVNIEAGIKLNHPSYVTYVDPYVTPIPYQTLTVIRQPPIYRIQAAKAFDTGFINNYIKLNAYQFTYRYQYKNYQYSCLSTFSQLMPYNAASDNFNYIALAMNFSEVIPDYVQQIDFCVRYGNTGKTFIIRSYNKNNSYDLIAILSHNAGAVQLGFAFYDNLIGIALDDTTANTSFHNVALKAKTLEIGKNRAFLANVLKGYDTPSATSLTLTLGTFNTGGGTYSGFWRFMRLSYYNVSSPSVIHQQDVYYAYVTGVNPAAYYYSAYRNGIPFPTPLNASDANVTSDTESNLAYYIIRNNIDAPAGCVWTYIPAPTFDVTAAPVDIIVAATSVSQFFKSSSTYLVSIAFFDRFRRKCGVVTPFVPITINDRTDTQTIFATTINWILNNTSALTEIPNWAFYYQIHISKNQTTPFFVQIFANDSNYAVRADDGTFTYGTKYALNSTYAIAINLTALTNKGLGYVFNEGDLARIYFSGGTNHIYTVLGTDGNYVLLSPSDIGTLGAGVGFLIELFTPYKSSISEPLYETGDVLPILNPTTTLRQYSTLSGTINGDVYAIERDNGSNLYFVEAMSPNDNVWQFWQTDRGWVNFIDTIGQQLKETNIDYSNTFINGTKVNGLNNFGVVNTRDVGSSSGSIQKLQLTNKQQEDGTIMLVITDADCLSAYLGEVQLVAAAANDGSPIQLTEVIGTINALKNGYGTINPESVVEYNGTVWWIDLLHGIAAQYAQDGVTVISDYKMRRFFDIYAKRYLALGAAGVESLCGFSYIESTVDVSTDEVLFTLPQTQLDSFVSVLPSYLIGTGIWKYMLLYYTTDGTTPIPLNLYYILLDDTTAYYAEIYQNPAELPLFVNFSDVTAVGFSEVALAEYILDFLPAPAGTWVNPQTPTYFVVPNQSVNLFNAEGAISVQNRFDIYDGQPKTLSFKYLENKWQNAYLWLPDCMDYLGSQLIGFKNGICYLHNESTTSFNVIYGVQYPQRICFALNGVSPSALKNLFDIAVEANIIPNFTVAYCEYPNVQITDLTVDEFTTIEGIQFARFFFDRLSPNATGTPDERMYKGDVLASVTPLIMLEFSEYDNPLIIKFINLGFEILRGLTQTNNINKPKN